ncbi:hypothetical protein FWK35_00014585, partial [Aphis craccivora]
SRFQVYSTTPVPRDFIHPPPDKYNIQQNVIIKHTILVNSFIQTNWHCYGSTIIQSDVSNYAKTTKWMGQYTLGYYMEINIKREEGPSQEFIEEAIDLKVRKKLLHYVILK